jgi:hypothetical protein
MVNKSVFLNIIAYKYYCNNSECKQKVFVEELNGFTGKSRRMTERLESLIIAIGLNTNCEATARICRSMGIIISGDTVIRLLLNNVCIESVKPEEIGIDDWAYKKRKVTVPWPNMRSRLSGGLLKRSLSMRTNSP